MTDDSQNTINYDDFDINPLQATVLDFIRHNKTPSGELLVKGLLSRRYNWFAVYPHTISGFVTLAELAENRTALEGLIVYTDLSGIESLMDFFRPMTEVKELSYIVMKSTKTNDGIPDTLHDSSGLKDYMKNLPQETRAYIFVGWDLDKETEDRFYDSFSPMQ